MEPIFARLTQAIDSLHVIDLKAKELEKQIGTLKHILQLLVEGQNISPFIERIIITGFDGGAPKDIRLIVYQILHQHLRKESFHGYTLDWSRVTKVMESDFQSSLDLEIM